MTQMAAALVQYGPLSIGINALPLQLYIGGVLNLPGFLCPPQLDHGVALVGYGVQNDLIGSTDYWKVRNSWGNWGESGYFRIVRGKGACGLNTLVTTATGIEFRDDLNAEQKFREFEGYFGKNSFEDREARLAAFTENLERIAMLQEASVGATFSHLTPFADVS